MRPVAAFVGLVLFVMLMGSSAAQSQPTPQVLVSRWDGVRRFNVLVIGMDRRPSEKNTL